MKLIKLKLQGHPLFAYALSKALGATLSFVFVVCILFFKEDRSIINNHGLQPPRYAESHEDVKHVASYGVRDRHVTKACRGQSTCHALSAGRWKPLFLPISISAIP